MGGHAAAVFLCQAGPTTPRPVAGLTWRRQPPPTPRSYGTVAPLAAENFAALALGNTTGGVGYKGTSFFRAVEGFMIQVEPCGCGARLLPWFAAAHSSAGLLGSGAGRFG